MSGELGQQPAFPPVHESTSFRPLNPTMNIYGPKPSDISPTLENRDSFGEQRPMRRTESQESLYRQSAPFISVQHPGYGSPTDGGFSDLGSPHHGPYASYPPTPGFPSYPPVPPHHPRYAPPIYFPPAPGYPPYPPPYPYPHDPYFSAAYASREDARNRTNKRMQVVRACLNCRKRKKKCNGEKPCDRCVTLRIEDECVYDEEDPKPKKRQKSEDEPTPPAVTPISTPSLSMLGSAVAAAASASSSSQSSLTSALGSFTPAFSQATLAALGSAISGLINIPNLAAVMTQQTGQQSTSPSSTVAGGGGGGGGSSSSGGLGGVTPTIDPHVNVVAQLLSLAGANSANLEKFSADLKSGASAMPTFGSLLQMPVPQDALSAAAAAATTPAAVDKTAVPTSSYDTRPPTESAPQSQTQSHTLADFLRGDSHTSSLLREDGHEEAKAAAARHFLNDHHHDDDLHATSESSVLKPSAASDAQSNGHRPSRVFDHFYPSSLCSHHSPEPSPSLVPHSAPGSNFPNFSFLDGFGTPPLGSCNSPSSMPSPSMYPVGFSLLTGLEPPEPSPHKPLGTGGSSSSIAHSSHHHSHHSHAHAHAHPHPHSHAASAADYASKLPTSEAIVSLTEELKHEKDQNSQLRQEIELLREECMGLRAKIPHFISKLRTEGSGCSFVDSVLADQVMNCPTAMMVRDVRDLSIVLVNSKFCEILGYSPEEMRSSPKCQWWKIIHPSCWLDIVQMVLAYFSSPKAASMSYIMKQNYVHKDGSIVPVVCSLMLLSDDNEPFPHYCIINLVTTQ